MLDIKPSHDEYVSTNQSMISINEDSDSESRVKRKTMSENSIVTKRKSVFDLYRFKEKTDNAVHLLSPLELESVYNTSITKGLRGTRADELLQMKGPNTLVDYDQDSIWGMLREGYFSWFNVFLYCGATMCIILHFVEKNISTGGAQHSNEHLYLGGVIFGTTIAASTFGLYQNTKSIRIMRGFQDMVPAKATVLRDSKMRLIASTDLVVGDIVHMAAGEMVPADVRILKANNFKIEMTSITGESEPVFRSAGPTDLNYLETQNLAFFTCNIVEGAATGMVFATGADTEVGRIAGLTTGITKEKTPISKEITRFIKIMCFLAFILGIALFLITFLAFGNIITAFSYALGIIIANVPEGLIVTLALCLTATSLKLRKNNCLAKTWRAIETLGSTSCICSDKTGTLTCNIMTVSHLFFDNVIVEKDDYSQRNSQGFNSLCTAACLCLRAEFIEPSKEHLNEPRAIKGDASEIAVLRYMEITFGASKLRESYPKVCEVPFNSTNKYQISIHKIKNSDDFLLVMKGAPEIILKRCDTAIVNQEEIELNESQNDILRQAFLTLGKYGERVLGYCTLILNSNVYTADYLFNSENPNFPVYGLKFVGFISLIDPPRASVPSALSKCRSAGIRVIMVTGDHPATALAIAKQVGIISTGHETAYEHPDYSENKTFKAAVITGSDLIHLGKEGLQKSIKNFGEIVFARTTPEQKLTIVECCQNLGYVVAVTGDGVNDSPALKKANIGISMGITGTDVSKRAADMILLDDDFSSIVLGVEEGRLVFDNLKKSIAYTLTSNVPEMFPFLLHALFGFPLPINVLLIIAINVGTDLLPAISLAYEKSEADIMHRPPRKTSEHLVTLKLIYMGYLQIGVIQFFGGMHAFLAVFAAYGFSPFSLFFIKHDWYSSDVKAIKDSYDQEWNYEGRMALTRKGQTAYFFAIIVVQVSDLLICKTRRISMFKKLCSNLFMGIAVAVELLIGLFIVYLNFTNEIFGTLPLEWYFLVMPIPYFIYIIAFDELRKYLIRKYPGGWVFKQTYY